MQATSTTNECEFECERHGLVRDGEGSSSAVKIVVERAAIRLFWGLIMGLILG